MFGGLGCVFSAVFNIFNNDYILKLQGVLSSSKFAAPVSGCRAYQFD